MAEFSLGLGIVLFLVLCSVFVNGWTDAPNAIATVVSTRSMKPRHAVYMAAAFNLIGACTMGTAVANTVGKIIEIQPGQNGLVIIGAAQFAIVVWAVSAWMFGIPTSESHALVAALTGAGVASMGDFSAVSWEQWKKVLFGLVASSFFGFLAGLLMVLLIVLIFKNVRRRHANNFFTIGQIASAASMAYSHGAQDGQKFAGVFALALATGMPSLGLMVGGKMHIPLWILILVALVMGFGTSIGGYKIIKTMGMDMVKLERYQGFSAEIAASGCMVVLTWLGIPVSTTQMKGTAIMGVGASKGAKAINWKVVGDMVLAWVLTFPACGIIGYVMTKLFTAIF